MMLRRGRLRRATTTTAMAKWIRWASSSSSATTFDDHFDGAAVPVYLSSHGRIVKRNWAHNNSNWCELCSEPIPSWVQHHGRMDHSLLEMHYSAVADYHRAWNAQEVLSTFTAVTGASMQSLLHLFAADDQRRRSRINRLASFFVESKVIDMAHIGGSGIHGALLQNKCFLTPLMRLFPDADVGALTNMMGFCMSYYNLETVYDLCGFSIIDVDGRQSRGRPQTTKSEETAAVGQQEEGVAYSRKGLFVRTVLGQLRWCVDESQPPPSPPSPSVDFDGDLEPLRVVGEELVNALLSECVLCRVCEYVVRCESVWKRRLERRRLTPLRLRQMAAECTPDIPGRGSYSSRITPLDDLYWVNTATDR